MLIAVVFEERRGAGLIGTDQLTEMRSAPSGNLVLCGDLIVGLRGIVPYVTDAGVLVLIGTLSHYFLSDREGSVSSWNSSECLRPTLFLPPEHK